MIKKLFFCESCRTQIADVEEIHYIEENSDRGFCSEKCIMDFYRPYMSLLEKEETQLRSDLALTSEEDYLDISANDHYLQMALSHPHEVWVSVDDIGQRFYTHIIEVNRDGEKIYFIIICSYVEGGPSFVYYRLATKYEEILNKYRRDDKYDEKFEEQAQAQNDLNQFQIPPEVIETMERKKSHLLSELMMNIKPHDIAIEEYVHYDQYMETTINDPDEIYSIEDEEGDELCTYIKSYKLNENTFFYIAIVYPFESEELGQKVYLPIMGFPSVDEEVYKIYASGKKLNDSLKN